MLGLILWRDDAAPSRESTFRCWLRGAGGAERDWGSCEGTDGGVQASVPKRSMGAVQGRMEKGMDSEKGGRNKAEESVMALSAQCKSRHFTFQDLAALRVVTMTFFPHSLFMIQ